MIGFLVLAAALNAGPPAPTARTQSATVSVRIVSAARVVEGRADQPATTGQIRLTQPSGQVETLALVEFP
jgi:hypothetical protein